MLPPELKSYHLHYNQLFSATAFSKKPLGFTRNELICIEPNNITLAFKRLLVFLKTQLTITSLKRNITSISVNIHN